MKTLFSLRRLPVSVLIVSVVMLFLSLQACEDNVTGSNAESPEGANGEAQLSIHRENSGVVKDTLNKSILGVQTVTLPFTGTVSSSVPAFEVKQSGGGISGRFEITNAFSSGIALDGVTRGTGHALLAWNLGLGRAAVLTQTNTANTLPAVDISTSGTGSATEMSINNSNSSAATLLLDTRGTGTPLVVDHLGTAGALAIFRLAGRNKARITRTGKGFFNGGTQVGGADVAEAFDVEGRASGYEPGDVLVISTRTDRTVEKSREPYSTLVAGVFATKPGVLLTERDIDEHLDDTVPMGVIGVIPTKISAENGPIRRGDLLVTAATPGHAMRADRDRLEHGTLLGKALENFTGPGTGVIRVLVTPR